MKKILSKTWCWFWLALVVIISIRLYLYYYGFVVNDFVVPPGDDAARHIFYINQLVEQFTLEQMVKNGYPPGVHVIATLLHFLTGAEVLKIIIWLGPIIGILPIIAAYIFGQKLFSPLAGIIAAMLVGFSSVPHVLFYVDGAYPNLVGAGFLMVLALTYLTLALRENPQKNLIWAGVWALLIPLFHHLSFAVFLVILIPFLAIMILLNRGPQKLPYLKLVAGVALGALGLMLLMALALFYKKLHIFWEGLLTGEGLTSGLAGEPRSIIDLPNFIGRTLLILGILGVLGLVFNRKIEWERKVLLLVWIGVMFALARTDLSGLPRRFDRELAMPLALVAGWFFAYIAMKLRFGWRRNGFLGVLILGISANIVMLNAGPYALPQGFSSMIWFTRDDLAKIDYLKTLPPGSTIAATPSSDYFRTLLIKQKIIFTANPSKYDYIFISPLSVDTNEPERFHIYNAYIEIKKALEAFQAARVIKTFPDGAVVKKVMNN